MRISLSPAGFDLFNYIMSDPTFVEDVKKNFVVTGIVGESDLTGKFIGKTWAFVGGGCGITWMECDKRSKKAVAFCDLCREVRRAVESALYDTFTEEQIDYFKRIGSPVMAVLQQDQQIQIEFYRRAEKYGKEVLGLNKIWYRSVID